MNLLLPPQPITSWFNPVKHALREGKVCIGITSVTFPCPAMAQISASAGYNFFYFDMEHSGLSIQSVEPICTAARMAGITPIGGPSGIAGYLISRLLDNGAMGVIVPHVSTRQETEIVVNACLYEPLGCRGIYHCGPATIYQQPDMAEWVQVINDEILVGVKVESARGVENIEEIVEVPGLDVVVIGIGDLSLSLGVPGQYDHPTCLQAVEHVFEACHRKGVYCGPPISTLEELQSWVDRGATFIQSFADSMLVLEASKQIIKDAHRLLGNRMFSIAQDVR